ncbi:AP-2 complex subunit alpha-like [Halyomorpha halys]|uniref:AP-2 complex subunit alpha-like n=1 Tax=Halyomorpha halys TaxID=286706 RepID=UPI000D0C8787|nr:AP-2 complex subunit alpha-like [Halyomorpha halys]
MSSSEHTTNYNSNHLNASPTTNNSATDFLGLSTPTNTVLLDLLVRYIYGSGNSINNTQLCTVQQNTYNPKKLICKNNGVLFENDLIQIGVKSEFRQTLGRLGLFYGNKTSYPLQCFTASLLNPNEWVSKLSLQIKPIEPVIDAGVQVQQMVNVECVEDYSGAPSMNISFIYNNVLQTLTIKLPIFINKFFEPTDMNGESFFARWKKLAGDPQKSQVIFRATQRMNFTATRTKLVGFGMQLLDGIDPNPENFVCAGIVHTKTQQIGCLLRLEPNKQSKMYRLTVRSSKESVSQEICELLSDQF